MQQKLSILSKNYQTSGKPLSGKVDIVCRVDSDNVLQLRERFSKMHPFSFSMRQPLLLIMKLKPLYNEVFPESVKIEQH